MKQKIVFYLILFLFPSLKKKFCITFPIPCKKSSFRGIVTCVYARCGCMSGQECKELEECFRTQFTDKILGGDADQINMKREGDWAAAWTERRGLSCVNGRLHRLQRWQEIEDG